MQGETGGMPDSMPTGILNQTGWQSALEGNNPLLNIGLGILANNSGNYGSAMAALSKGTQQGIKDTQASRQAQQQAALYKLQLAKAQKDMEDQKKKEDWIKNYGLLPNSTQETTTQAPDTWQNAMQGQTQPNFNMERVAGEKTTTQTPIFDQNKALLSGVQNGVIDFKDYLTMTEKAKPKYSQTPQYDQQGNAFVLDDNGNVKRLDGIKERQELMVTPSGLAINKNDPTNIGKTFNADDNNPNKPFIMVNGQVVPNKAYQDYELRKAGAGASRTNVSVGGAQILPEKFTDKINMLAAEGLMGQYGEARNAATAVSAVKDAMTLLDKGMFTGKAAGVQESLAGWYQAATGETMPKLDATQQFKTVIGDIVLPALSNLKGASSDRDFIKIEEYSRGQTDMTESALRGHLKRLQNKYGSQIKNYNSGYKEYISKNGKKLPGMDEIKEPNGNFPSIEDTGDIKKSTISSGGWSAKKVK